MPWPVPWYIQGIMLDGRAEDIQEKTNDITEIMSEETEELGEENQDQNAANFALVETSRDKWTRIQKRGQKKGPSDPRTSILKNGPGLGPSILQ